MADIFVSYARSDRERAKTLAEAFEEIRYEVWWDPKIPPGKTFDEVIAEALGNAKCIVVLWSKESVKSEWVKEEASRGKRRKILVPALIDDVELPLGFGLIQAADLTDWEKGNPHSGFDSIIEAIAAIVGPPPAKELERKAAEEKQRKEQEELERKAAKEKRRKETDPRLYKVPGKWQSPTFYVAILLRSLCYGALVAFAFAYYEVLEWNTFSPEFAKTLNPTLWKSFGMGIGAVLALELSEELIISGVSIKIVGVLAPVLIFLAGGVGGMLTPSEEIIGSSSIMMFFGIVGCAVGGYGAKRSKNESRVLRFAGACTGSLIGAILGLLILILAEDWGSRGSSAIYWYTFLSGVLPGSVVSIRAVLPRPMGAD